MIIFYEVIPCTAELIGIDDFGVMESPVNSIVTSSLDFDFNNAATHHQATRCMMHPSVR